MSSIEDVKQRTDIVDLISQHATLKRAGRNYVALCPFHTEKTPSFHVDPSRQTWHCFGACSTGGDVLTFVMKKEGCDFREALRVLAERAGVELERRGDRQADARRARLYEINETAAAFFHAQLLDDSGSAGAYVLERRLARASIEKFQLGHAPNGWDALVSHLTARNIVTPEIVGAGLAIEGERGPYDRFRHRLMFPIRDERGRVVGFGGRLLPGEGAGAAQPKYLNTPQSPIFDKGTVLYALDLAKDAVRSEGRAVIVEGYMDAIAAHEHGFANVVASMGTALTERQTALLKRYTRNVVLALDSDAAGSEATLRGVQIVAAAADREPVPVPNWRGMIRQQEMLAGDIRVATMPLGSDPDSVIRSDPDRWRQMVDDAKPVIDHLFDVAASVHDLSSPRARSAACDDLLPMIGAISDAVVQAHYVQRLARMARVDEAALRVDLRRPSSTRAAGSSSAGAAQSNDEGRTRSHRAPKEEFLLALLFRYPDLRAAGIALAPELFEQSENRTLFEGWAGSSGEGESFERSLAPDLRPHFERITHITLPTYDDPALERALRSTVWGIEQQRLRNAKRARAAVVADIAAQDGQQVVERAHSAWQAGAPAGVHDGEDEADPATAFVEDMEVGLQVHQRLLEQRRVAARPDRSGGE